MEAAGFAIGLVGLAGLFSSCIEAVARAHSYRSFSSDSKALDLQFSATKLRLETWGCAVGFAGEGAIAAAGDETPLHHPALDDEQIQSATVEIFGFVKQICEEAVSAGRLRLGNAADSSLSRDTSLKPNGSGVRRKLSWAIGGKLRRTEQVELFKELVQTLHNLVPPDDYEAGRPVASAWSTEFGQIMSRLEAQARQDVHAWLQHIPSERYNDSLQRRLDGTCLWMLNEPLFLRWMVSELSPGPSILWIHGPAGFGKTIMCANIIQHLTNTLTTPTAHFFFSSDSSDSRDDPFLAIRCLVSQVISSHDGAFRLALERQQCDLDPTATRHTIMSIFESIACLVPGCTFVLDGLDECTNIDGGGRDSVVFLLDAVVKALAGAKARLLVVSRFLAEIQHSLRGDEPERLCEYKLRPSHVQADIAAYSRDVVERKLQNKNIALRASLSKTMAERCEGQFLWIRLQGDSLRRGMSKKQLEEAVKDTPTNLERIYDHSWALITQLKDADRTRAFALLRWAAFAQRPLAVVEVVEAVLVEETQQCDVDDLIDEIDEDYVETEIIGLCGPLLEIKTDNERCGHWTLHLPHFTVRQYLAGRLPTPGWVRSSQLHAQITPARLLLRHGANIGAACHNHNVPLANAAYYGHVDVAKVLLEHDASLKVADNASTLLQIAVGQGHAEVVKLLLGRGADVDATGTNGCTQTPLYTAVIAGRLDLVKMLLEKGADVTKPDGGGILPLYSAASHGHLDVARALLDSGADVSAAGGHPKEDWPALFAAVHFDHEAVTRLLLERGADGNFVSQDGKSPLYFAVRKSHMGIVKLLLESGADASGTNTPELPRPLCVATWNGQIGIMKLLLSHGADPMTPSLNGLRPLDHAAKMDNFEAMETLIKSRPGAGWATEKRARSLVRSAARSGNVNIFKLFFEHGVCAAPDERGELLHIAARYDRVAIIEELIAVAGIRSVEIDYRDELQLTPLFLAARAGRLQAVRSLVRVGASQKTADWKGWTPLSAAVQCGRWKVAAILQAYQAEGDAQSVPGSSSPDSDNDVAATEAVERGIAYCDSCLRDVPDDSGKECALCGNMLFYLCAKCFSEGCGCPDPTHEFWPARAAAVTEGSEKATSSQAVAAI
ncbi:hypothetical protein ACHAQA_009848 [Verticillium albo-atrum]